MMVLSRKIGETIVIDGGKITITVMDIQRGNKVRIGVQAPREVAIDRQEVYLAKLKSASKEGDDKIGAGG